MGDELPNFLWPDASTYNVSDFQPPPEAKYHGTIGFTDLVDDTSRLLGVKSPVAKPSEYIKWRALPDHQDVKYGETPDVRGVPMGAFLDIDSAVPLHAFGTSQIGHMSQNETYNVLATHSVHHSTDITMPVATTTHTHLSKKDHLSAVAMAREAALGVEEEVARVAAAIAINAPLPPKDETQVEFWISSCSLKAYKTDQFSTTLADTSEDSDVCPRLKHVYVREGPGRMRVNVYEYQRPLSSLEIDGLQMHGKRIEPANSSYVPALTHNRVKKAPSRMVGFRDVTRFDGLSSDDDILEAESAIERDVHDAYGAVEEYTNAVFKYAEECITERRKQNSLKNNLQILSGKFKETGIPYSSALVPLGIHADTHLGYVCLRVCVAVGVGSADNITNLIGGDECKSSLAKEGAGIYHCNPLWALSTPELQMFLEYAQHIVAHHPIPEFLVEKTAMARFYKAADKLCTTEAITDSIVFSREDRDLFEVTMKALTYLVSSGDYDIEDTPAALVKLSAILAQKLSITRV